MIPAPIDALERTDRQLIGIGGSLRQRQDSLSRQHGRWLPGPATIVTYVETAVRPADPMNSSEDPSAIRLIDEQAVHNEVVRCIHLTDTFPIRAAIQRLKDPAIGIAQIQMTRFAQHRCKSPRIASVWANRSPLIGICLRIRLGMANSRKPSGEKQHSEARQRNREPVQTRKVLHYLQRISRRKSGLAKTKTCRETKE